MNNLNYYSHLLLNSKYSLLIKLTIFFSIYMSFYLNNIVYCIDEFYIYWPGDSDNVIDKDVEYYGLNNEHSRQLLLNHRNYIIKQQEKFSYFILYEHKEYWYQVHNQRWSPPENGSFWDEFESMKEGFLTRNKKPFVDLDYSGLKINKQRFLDDRGKIIREISTIKHPCDCFSTTKRYIDVYYPSYHPDNSFKPHSEVNRHLVETKPGCTIS